MLPEITSEAIFVPKMPLVRLECMAGAISVRHNTRQSSQGVSVTIVDLVRVGPDEVGLVDDINTASGPDNISARMLKATALHL